MSISSVGSLGTFGSSISTNTIALTSAIAVAEMDWIIVVVSCTNSSTTDGNNSEISSVTDNRSNAWFKIGEQTNSEGAAGSGITVSVWATQVPIDLHSGGLTVTANFTSNRTERVVTGHVFRSSTKAGIQIYDTAVANVLDAANDFGSSVLAANGSIDALYFRGLGKQANTATQLTPSSGFTAITNIRSQAASSARCAYGEFKIQTSSGATSNPTLAVSGNAAGIFASLRESVVATGEARITQEYLMAINSTDMPPIRLTQEGAIVVNSTDLTPVRMTQLSFLVIHTRPPAFQPMLIGYWI